MAETWLCFTFRPARPPVRAVRVKLLLRWNTRGRETLGVRFSDLIGVAIGVAKLLETLYGHRQRRRWAPLVDGPGLPGIACALVAQLDRALDYESRGQEFESLRARHSRPHWDHLQTRPSSWHHVDGATGEGLRLLASRTTQCGMLQPRLGRDFDADAPPIRPIGRIMPPRAGLTPPRMRPRQICGVPTGREPGRRHRSTPGPLAARQRPDTAAARHRPLVGGAGRSGPTVPPSWPGGVGSTDRAAVRREPA